ncbi:DegV family protein [Anaerocolumna jejuensis]|uniref:DegV family protein n=1 Tax=Anaerocolumna jejuensis TaxID=259063 RepID=UPI003F7C22E2
MRDYVIVTDGTADLTQEMIEKLGIISIPMDFEVEGKTYVHYPDARELSAHDFYDMLRQGSKSVTSLINAETFLTVFEPLVKEGKDILYIAFSSALSGTYNSSLIAKEELEEKYSDANIKCFDSRCASVGEGLLVYTAAGLKNEGYTIEELYAWLEKNTLHLCHWFTVDDLFHLKRGGRVSALSAGIGTALNIKPVLHVDNEGRLIPMEKVRGRKKSIQALFEHMEAAVTSAEDQVIFIGHGDAAEDAEYLAELVKEKFPVKDVIINYIGPVIGTHSGPGTIALFFFGSGR